MQERRRTTLPESATLKKIIVEGDVEELVIWAEKIGNGLARHEQLTTSQVRSFFGTVRQIQAEVEAGVIAYIDSASSSEPRMGDGSHRRLMLLKPRLAYQAQRDKENRKGEGVLRLKEILTPAIDLVGHDVQRFKNLVEFFEAILAYHKAAGGQES